MRILLLVLGCLFLMLGGIGVFLPLLPTTPFVLLAAFCFARSSPRFYHWLLTNPVFGPSLRSWQKSRSIPRKIKYMAVSTIILSGAITISFFLHSPLIQVVFVTVLIIPLVILLRIPNSEDLASVTTDGDR